MDSKFSELIKSVSNLSVQNQSYFNASSEIICNVLSMRFCSNNRWHITTKNISKQQWESLSPMDLDNLKCKFVVKDKIHIDSDQSNICSELIPKIFHHSIQSLKLFGQILTMKEFQFLTPLVEECILFDVHINGSNKDNCNYECLLKEILESLPKLLTLEYKFNDQDTNNESVESIAKDLIEFPRFTNKMFEYCIKLTNIPEHFDITLFYDFLKNSTHIDFELEFSKNISELYKANLKTVVTNIINNDTTDYFPPLITYDGIDERDVEKMESSRHWWLTGELPNYR